MAKNSVIARQKKRVKHCLKYRALREQLKSLISSPTSDDEQKWDAVLQLQKLPRDSSVTRLRNRCRHPTCGRPRAYNRLTGLCRMHFRDAMLKGFIPGVCKASW